MPHLQFDLNKKLKNQQRENFTEFVKKKFSEIMNTDTGHIAISIREFPKNALTLGRTDKNNFVCFMNLDIREGRSKKQKRTLVQNYMKGVEKILGVKTDNQYVTFTSHPGNDFNLYEKALDEWFKDDKPLS